MSGQLLYGIKRDDKKTEFGTILTKWIKGNTDYWPRKTSSPKPECPK